MTSSNVKRFRHFKPKINKMSKKNQHVVPHGDEWAVKGAGNSKATKVVDTQAEAIRIAREIAINKKSEVVIHQIGRAHV